MRLGAKGSEPRNEKPSSVSAHWGLNLHPAGLWPNSSKLARPHRFSFLYNRTHLWRLLSGTHETQLLSLVVL